MTSAEMWKLVEKGDWSPATLAALSDLLEEEGASPGDTLILALRYLAREGLAPRETCPGRYLWTGSDLQKQDKRLFIKCCSDGAFHFAEQQAEGNTAHGVLLRLGWGLTR